MNKWQFICPIVAVLLTAVALGSIHMRRDRRALAAAVAHQVDGHALKIAELLSVMRGSNLTVVEDATFQELQTTPSSSLISRSMITVAPLADGHLECVIDTSSLGFAPRIIRSSP